MRLECLGLRGLGCISIRFRVLLLRGFGLSLI